MDEGFLKRDEKLVLALRGMYERYGYRKYKMRRFEEYDLYLNNRDFLQTKHIITFHDLDGRVMALKPDVTLSIAKNTRATAESTEKIYYLENVYQLDPIGAYREISQLGLECFGRLDEAGFVEVLLLAVKTLSQIDENYRISISDTRFVKGLLRSLALSGDDEKRLAECIRNKRAHEVYAFCEAGGISGGDAKRAAAVAELGGPFEEAAKKARALCGADGMTEALDSLTSLYEKLSRIGLGAHIRLDFSAINDLDYYSGIIFQGYVQGVPRPVLSGGYYGALLKKFGRELDAIGFAVYLSELAHLSEPLTGADVDELILYGEGSDAAALYEAAEMRAKAGKKIRVERAIPKDLRYSRLMKFDGKHLSEVTEHA